MRIRQKPAQGRADLTITPSDKRDRLLPIHVDWQRMEAVDLTEEEIREKLSEANVKVPPVIFQEADSSLWTYPISRPLTRVIAEILSADAKILSADADLFGAANISSRYRELGDLLTRYQAPRVVSKGERLGRERRRAISSAGELPEIDEHDRLQFEKLVDRFRDISGNAPRSGIVRSSGWMFLACPTEVRHHLLEIALENRVLDLIGPH